MRHHERRRFSAGDRRRAILLAEAGPRLWRAGRARRAGRRAELERIIAHPHPEVRPDAVRRLAVLVRPPTGRPV
ncbi:MULTISPECIES: hypothetical protein [Micromonospora]|uniref:hypothetical protein n=1 Tax=Micromonospora TaxID=1873 RepID=UPI0011B5298A|nr:MULTISPECIES: hypothetical protein [unclassified Micromonospora]MBM0224653.1 hypothetical protein [Micromonospora sp. ATA51]